MNNFHSSTAQKSVGIMQLEDQTVTEQVAYDWLRYLINRDRARLKSESSIFGTMKLKVPYAVSDSIEILMSRAMIPLLMKAFIRKRSTGEIVEVELTYKTKEIGIINMPI